MRVIYGCHVNLKDIYNLFFEDEKTKVLREIQNYSILDNIVPNDNCIAYWHFNPYAVFGTGFKSWSNPYFVSVFNTKETFELEKEGAFRDYMVRAWLNKESHMKDLCDYTGIKF